MRDFSFILFLGIIMGMGIQGSGAIGSSQSATSAQWQQKQQGFTDVMAAVQSAFSAPPGNNGPQFEADRPAQQMRTALAQFFVVSQKDPQLLMNTMQQWGASAADLQNAVPSVNTDAWLRQNGAANGFGGLRVFAPDEVSNFINWQNAANVAGHGGYGPQGTIGGTCTYGVNDPTYRAQVQRTMATEASRQKANPNYIPEYLTDYQSKYAAAEAVCEAQLAAQAGQNHSVVPGGGLINQNTPTPIPTAAPVAPYVPAPTPAPPPVTISTVPGYTPAPMPAPVIAPPTPTIAPVTPLSISWLTN